MNDEAKVLHLSEERSEVDCLLQPAAWAARQKLLVVLKIFRFDYVIAKAVDRMILSSI